VENGTGRYIKDILHGNNNIYLMLLTCMFNQIEEDGQRITILNRFF